MKEVSLVIGELARRVNFDSDGLLDPEQLRDAGNRLLTTLLTLKHNGAIEKTLVGLTCLGERLLRSAPRGLARNRASGSRLCFSERSNLTRRA